jgi:hypothetical protein
MFDSIINFLASATVAECSCYDLRPRSHDLGNTSIAELDYGLNKLALGLLDDSGFFSDVYKGLNLFLGFVCFFFGDRLFQLRFPHSVQEPCDGCDEHGEEAIKDLEHRQQHPENVFRIVLSQKAGDELPEEHHAMKAR